MSVVDDLRSIHSAGLGDVDDIPTAEQLLAIGFTPTVADTISKSGVFTWRVLATSSQIILMFICRNNEQEAALLEEIAENVYLAHVRRTHEELRADIVEYLFSQDALPEFVVDLVRSYADVLGNRAELIRAQNEVTFSRRLKEIFRRAVHTTLRV